MKPISSLLVARPTTRANSERAEILEQILNEVNSERKGTKYKPMAAKVLAIKLAHLEKRDLLWLHSTCKDYRNRKGSYGKCLFGSVKIRV